ncbi:carboxylesterase/lipase family protein [Streptomyces sp. NBC_00996]|uniref:carboxylesterase/lipase family protein n=1 Tax=Streptomyces sp. NBC_00996 TaxID=2903710 RepID=UPI00386DE634|nr:carboxylesterase family protein [Streptomyces sp. NBC_00996]
MTVVHTRSGVVRGISFDGVRAWRGIPYARPPVGDLRWAAPQRETPWQGIRDGGRFGNRAPQQPSQALNLGYGEGADADTPMDEDCLYLNVCTPDVPGGSRLPVQVWIHGGGYVVGSGPEHFGDGAAVARRGVVVVTFNYRLGALGMLNLAALLGRQENCAANNTLRDQIAALRWVRENIPAFGGDPGNVTVHGVSAGGKSVVNLMATPAAKGLFHGAIVQSGGDHVAEPDTTADLARRFTGLLGLSDGDLGCLRDVPATELLAAQLALSEGTRATWTWRPTIDGGLLPQRPTRALSLGRAAGIPLLIGSTGNEAGGYHLMDPTAREYTAAVRQEIFGPDADHAAAMYAALYPNATREETDRMFMSDERYGAPTLQIADAQSRHAPVWHYRFTGPAPGQPSEFRMFHGTDIPYAWGLLEDSGDPGVAALCRGILDAWTAFRYRAVPYSPHLPAWPEYDRVTRATMVLGTAPHITLDGAVPQYAPLWADQEWIPGTWWPQG